MLRSHGRGRSSHPLFLGVCLSVFVLESAHGMMMTQHGGAEPVEDRGWPKGVLKFANLPCRVSWVHMMGNFGWDSYTLCRRHSEDGII